MSYANPDYLRKGIALGSNNRTSLERLKTAAALLLISLCAWGLSVWLASMFALSLIKGHRRDFYNMLSIEGNLPQVDSLAGFYALLFNSQVKFPPLLYMATLPFRGLRPFGDDRLDLLIVMLPFFVAFNVGFYMLLRVKLGRGPALIGTALVCLSPGILKTAAAYSHNFPCMALLFLAFAIVARGRVFERTRDTLGLAAISVAALMLYYSMPLFIGPTALYALVLAWRENPTQKGRVFNQALLFAAIVFIACSPYYLAGFAVDWGVQRITPDELQVRLASESNVPFYFMAPMFALNNAAFLIWSLFQWLTPLALLLMLIGRSRLLPATRGARRILRPNHVGGMLLFSSLTGILFCVLFWNKTSYYLLPLVPVIGYPLCLALDANPFKRRRALLTTVAVGFMALSIGYTLFSQPRFSRQQVEQVFKPITAECQSRESSCLVLMHSCYVPVNNFFMQADRPWDEKRNWIQNPPSPERGGPPAERVDFIVVELEDNRLTASSTPPFSEPCALVPTIDPRTGKVERMEYYGRDVSGMFIELERVESNNRKLLLFGRSD
ncbi:MAG: glycosyltransferase family 39 protein [Candidatus Alcyoniella australis]|nr:glycosyltransferase family 39 protein [Candidatus Alcyoniella australis]